MQTTELEGNGEIDNRGVFDSAYTANVQEQPHLNAQSAYSDSLVILSQLAERIN